MNQIERLWADLSEWSQATFGSDSERGPVGALKHLATEVDEALAAPGDLTEYADCLMLILDAARRAGYSLDQLTYAALVKLGDNKLRNWPMPTSATEPVMHLK